VSAPQGREVGEGDDSTGTGAAGAPQCAGRPSCGRWRNGPLPEPPRRALVRQVGCLERCLLSRCSWTPYARQKSTAAVATMLAAVAPVVSWSASSRRASSGASSSRITRRCSEDSCASSRAVSVGSPGPTYPHRSKIWSSNPLERLNREVKRRTDVVGIFPNPAALLRPSSCVVIEDHDEWTWVHRRCKCQSDDPGRQSVTSQVLCAYARWTRHRVSSVTPGALWLARRRSTAPRLPNRAT